MAANKTDYYDFKTLAPITRYSAEYDRIRLESVSIETTTGTKCANEEGFSVSKISVGFLVVLYNKRRQET